MCMLVLSMVTEFMFCFVVVSSFYPRPYLRLVPLGVVDFVIWQCAKKKPLPPDP